MPLIRILRSRSLASTHYGALYGSKHEGFDLWIMHYPQSRTARVTERLMIRWSECCRQLCGLLGCCAHPASASRVRLSRHVRQPSPRAPSPWPSPMSAQRKNPGRLAVGRQNTSTTLFGRAITGTASDLPLAPLSLCFTHSRPITTRYSRSARRAPRTFHCTCPRRTSETGAHSCLPPRTCGSAYDPAPPRSR